MISVIMCADEQAGPFDAPAPGQLPAPGHQARERARRGLERAREREAGRAEIAGTAARAEPLHVFICCKRGDVYAQDIIARLAPALGPAYQVVYDDAAVTSLPWAGQLSAELSEADVVIAILSRGSVDSEMVELELRTARDRAATARVVVVRLPSGDPLPYPLRRYVEDAEHVFYTGDEQRLLGDIRSALGGDGSGTQERSPADPSSSGAGASQPPRPLPWADPEPPEGPSAPESSFYVERAADGEALKAIRRQRVTMTIKGPCQTGKSSLLGRVVAEARACGKQVVPIDFQLFDQQTLTDGELFFKSFCEMVDRQLGIESQVAKYWGDMGNTYSCRRYFERYLLPQLDRTLVLALDKVDRIPHEDLRGDFFGMLRTWHNDRASKPIFARLDLVLVTATEPARLIDKPNRSPFNVGTIVPLTDLTPAEVARLNQLHGQPFDPALAQALIALLGGRPFLVRRALYLAATGRRSPEQILAHAYDDDGPFGDHLRYHLFKLHNQPNLIRELRRIIRRGADFNEQTHHELYSAGLVRREGKRVLPCCQLYAVYFEKHLSQ